MTIADKLQLFRKFWPDTLKGRLWLLLVVVTIMPIALIGFTSYFWMYKAQEEKISSNYQSTVNTNRAALDKVFDNLSSVSQLLAVNGGLGDAVIDYLRAEDPVHKTERYLEINQSLTNIMYSSPNVSGLFINFPNLDSPLQFESAPLRLSYLKGEFRNDEFPVFFRANQLIYQGPHPSVFRNHDEKVFSLSRKIEYGAGGDFYIYLETRFSLDAKTPASGESGAIKRLLTDADGRIVFSELDDRLPGSLLDPGSLGAYKWFSAEGANGWKLWHIIPTSTYTKELNRWRIQFLLTALLSLAVTGLTASFIWRMVYRPLQQMTKEFKRFSYNRNNMPRMHTRLQEFNSLFGSFQAMRERVAELLIEIETKERRKAELEVEKLMSQINPHFLHNTLNTVQFLALEKGQKDIFNLVKVLTRVLQYNLSKTSMIVTIKEEIAALKDYIELQNIRYDHRFDVRIDVDPAVESVPLPRFVLQPLVENALYHGLQNDQGFITVQAAGAGPDIVITVADDGKGMTEDKINELLEGDGDRRSGLGIGLKYVRKMLEVYYMDEARMSILSRIGEGTIITITMPATIKGRDSHD